MPKDKSIDLPELGPDQACQMITPPAELKRKAITPEEGFSHVQNAINRAERALQELSVNFAAWMESEVSLLIEARDEIHAHGIDDETLDALYRTAHDIRGQAFTLGFPAAARLCDCLCFLIDTMPDTKRIPLVIIDQHVDSVRAVVRENVTTDDDETASALIKKLRSVTTEFVESEVKVAEGKKLSAA